MRILAFDYRDGHTGVAVYEPPGLLAGFTATVDARRPEEVVRQIALLAREHGAEELVLGYPRNMDGSLGPRAAKAEELASLLRTATGLPVTLWDERRTTVAAHQILLKNGRDGRKRKKVVDAVAASLILEGYLAYRRSGPGVY